MKLRLERVLIDYFTENKLFRETVPQSCGQTIRAAKHLPM